MAKVATNPHVHDDGHPTLSRVRAFAEAPLGEQFDALRELRLRAHSQVDVFVGVIAVAYATLFFWYETRIDAIPPSWLTQLPPFLTLPEEVGSTVSWLALATLPVLVIVLVWNFAARSRRRHGARALLDAYEFELMFRLGAPGRKARRWRREHSLSESCG